MTTRVNRVNGLNGMNSVSGVNGMKWPGLWLAGLLMAASPCTGAWAAGPAPAAKPAANPAGQPPAATTPAVTKTTTKIKPQEYGNLSRAAEFGVLTEGKMAKAIAGTGLQRHHCFEVRFKPKMDGDPRMKLTIAVTPAEHQAFTNKWHEAIGYGKKGTWNPDIQRAEIVAAARKIYEKYPAILKALDL